MRKIEGIAERGDWVLSRVRADVPKVVEVSTKYSCAIAACRSVDLKMDFGPSNGGQCALNALPRLNFQHASPQSAVRAGFHSFVDGRFKRNDRCLTLAQRQHDSTPYVYGVTKPNKRTVAVIGAMVFTVVAVIVGFAYEQSRDSRATASVSQPDSSAPALNAPTDDFDTVAILGDSYSIPNTTGDHWPALLAFDRRWYLADFASGGTGYVQGNEEKGKLPFGAKIDQVVAVNPEVVIIAGGRNDVSYPLEVRDATRELYAQLRDRLPHAKVVVIGPIMDNRPPSETAVNVNDRIRSAAEQYKLPFIDALAENWLSDPTLLKEDGMHPTPAGQRLMFEKISEHLHSLGL